MPIPPAADTIPPLRQIGGYRLVRELGRGGMGAVYEAVAAGDGDSRVALKVLHPHLAQDPRCRERFLNEARAIQAVRHPNLVRVLDAGEDAPGQVYLVMEFLDGPSLKERLDELRRRGERLAPEAAARLAAQAAAALSAVHRRRIVHRDLKPENLLLVGAGERPGEGGRVKLLDFGIAKFLDGSAPPTTLGTVLGTGAYMSPEQCLGAEWVGERSDVYSLGVLIYEMIAGEPPFCGGLLQVMEQHRQRVPPLLDERAPHAPAALVALVRDMLAKDPQMRPAMKEVAAALRRTERAAPPPPRPDPEPPGGVYNPGWYVPRERAERDVQSCLATAGKPAIVWAPELFGKTWLLERVLRLLQQRHTGQARVIRVSLDFFGEDCRRSYECFVRELAQQIGEELAAPPRWEDDAGRGPNRKLTRFIRHCLGEAPGPFVLAIDRADAILHCEFRDDFFGMLRGWAESAGRPEWARLRLLLAVSTMPLRLTASVHNSPFSGLSEPIELEDLDGAQAQRLGQLYGPPWHAVEAVQGLMEYVGGHPYLLRLAMHAAALHGLDPRRITAADAAPRIFERHLRHCRAAVEGQPALLQALRAVAAGDAEIGEDEYEGLHRLGLVVRQGRSGCRLRCRLYRWLVD